MFVKKLLEALGDVPPCPLLDPTMIRAVSDDSSWRFSGCQWRTRRNGNDVDDSGRRRQEVQLSQRGRAML